MVDWRCICKIWWNGRYLQDIDPLQPKAAKWQTCFVGRNQHTFDRSRWKQRQKQVLWIMTKHIHMREEQHHKWYWHNPISNRLEPDILSAESPDHFHSPCSLGHGECWELSYSSVCVSVIDKKVFDVQHESQKFKSWYHQNRVFKKGQGWFVMISTCL